MVKGFKRAALALTAASVLARRMRRCRLKRQPWSGGRRNR